MDFVEDFDFQKNVDIVNRNKEIPLREDITGTFDWLSCTFDSFEYDLDPTVLEHALFDLKSARELNKLVKILGKTLNINDFDFEYGANRYAHKIVLHDNIFLLVYGPQCSNGNRSTMLNCTGQGVKWLIETGRFYYVVKWIFDHDPHFTRLDNVQDNYTQIMDIVKVDELVSKGYWTSGFSKEFRVNGTVVKPKPGETRKETQKRFKGATFQLGLRGSALILRIYAKNWEQGCADTIPDWTRFELQINDHARIKQILAVYLMCYEAGQCYQDMFALTAGILKQFLSFKKPNPNDDNISRWEEDDEWKYFLNQVEALELITEPKSSSVFETKTAWFETSCTLFLTQAYLVMGKEYFLNFIYGLIIKKYDTFREKDFNIIRIVYDSLGLEFNQDELDEKIKELEMELKNKNCEIM